VTASSYSQTEPALWLPRLGGRLAAVGASAGVLAGFAELALGAHIRAWVGNKQDTTRLGVATITLSAIALLAAVTWLRRKDASPGRRLLIVAGLIVPGVICFTTVGRAWYLPGGLLVVAAAMAASELREDAREVLDTISRSWLAALAFVLGAFYIFLGATALGVPGVLGVVGGITIIAVVATSSRVPSRVGSFTLVAAALPFAVLTWWSIVTPLLAITTIAIGWRALRGG
jgi:uncharacterized membrane protein YozB (DUF420 family)